MHLVLAEESILKTPTRPDSDVTPWATIELFSRQSIRLSMNFCTALALHCHVEEHGVPEPDARRFQKRIPAGISSPQ